MSKIRYLLFVLLDVLLIAACSQDKTSKESTTPVRTKDTVLLKGNVFDRVASDTLILTPILNDARINRVLIPIINGEFHYALEGNEIQAFDLIFKEEHDNGSWRPIKFFNDADEIRFDLYDTDHFDQNKIQGGPLNEELAVIDSTIHNRFETPGKPYRDSVNVLFKSGLYSSKAAQAIYDELQNDEINRDSLYKALRLLRAQKKDITEEAQYWNTKLDSIYLLQIQWQFEYLEEHYSLVAYQNLLLNLLFLEDESDVVFQRKSDFPDTNETSVFAPYDVSNLKKYHTAFSDKFPNHSYNTWLSNKITSLDQIRVGGNFVDFVAPTIEGKEITFSEFNNDHITVLNLWASWCAPCIRHSIDLKPVYEKYKGKGFKVLAVAREHDNTKAMERIIERKKFPWLNLIDLNGVHNIWEKYNISNAGGALILIDQFGKIMAINPDVAEIEAELEKKYTPKI